MIERLAERLGYAPIERRAGYTDMALAASMTAALDGQQVIGAIEVAAGVIGRALAAAEIQGDDARYFDAETLLAIGRAMVIEGEYAALLAPGKTLIQLFDFELIPGALGATDPDYQLRYSIEGGATATADRFLHCRWSMTRTGRGAGVLQQARQLYKIAAHTERVLAESMSGIVGAVMPLPKVDNSTLASLKATLKNLKGKTAFVETLQQSGNARQVGLAQPKSDYQQIRIQPAPNKEWLDLWKQSEQMIYRAVGIPIEMLSRESLRQFWTGCIEPISKVIEAAAARRGLDIRLDFGHAARFDVAGRARAYGILVSNDFDEEAAAELTGFELDESVI